MDRNSAVKLFVGNLALDTSQEDLMTLFAPYGQVVGCSVLRQFAFVHLQGDGAADRAIRDLNGRDFKGRNLVVEESRGRPLNSTKVFVGNLSALCSAEDLQELFQTFGKVIECDKVKARLSSSAGYAFVHMERREDALTAIEALHGTTFKGRPLSVELSKIQPSKPVTACTIPCVTCGKLGHYAGDCPAGKASKEHHQSQAAVLAAAAAAAAGLPLQVQQSVHNSFYNTTSFDPTLTALKNLTTQTTDGKPVTAAVYGALASQVYGSVADQVLVGENDGPDSYSSHYNPAVGQAPSAAATNNPAYNATPALNNAATAHGADSTAQAIFEAARARFFEQGQQVLAEQQAVGKPPERDRSRSPVRRSTPLLPDPVPKPYAAHSQLSQQSQQQQQAQQQQQQRAARRALLPTPPGGPEEAPCVDEDPITRCYAEYYQQCQQFQQYQQYQIYNQYQQYTYPPPPPPPPPPAMPVAPVQQPMNHHPMEVPQHYLAAGAHAATPRVYEPPPSHKEPLLHRPDYPHLHTPEPPYR